MACVPKSPIRAVLARRGAFSVEQCRCGTLHLTLGVLTVRLDPLACAELASTVLEAIERLHEQAAVERTPRVTH